MFGEVLAELIAAFIGTVVGWFAFRAWNVYKSRFEKHYANITYFRVIRLRFQDRGDAPFYNRSHHSVDAVAEPVFDETWCLNAQQCNIPEILVPVQLTSSGIVDAFKILPTLDKDSDNHPHTRDASGMFMYSHPTESTVLSAIGTLINGLQTRENWWFGTTARYDHETIVLVVDFSSLPFDTYPIRNVRSILERDRKELSKSQVDSRWFEDRYGEYILYLKYVDAKKAMP